MSGEWKNLSRKQKKKETGRSFEQELTGVVICFIAVFVAMGILIAVYFVKAGLNLIFAPFMAKDE